MPSTVQEEFLQYCDHLPSKDLSAYHYIQDILSDWSSQEKLPENIINLLLTCLHQFYDDFDDSVRTAEAAHRGSLWINLGLLQIHLWLPQTTFDPAIKRKYKMQYAEEEVRIFKEVFPGRYLAVYFFLINGSDKVLRIARGGGRQTLQLHSNAQKNINQWQVAFT